MRLSGAWSCFWRRESWYRNPRDAASAEPVARNMRCGARIPGIRVRMVAKAFRESMLKAKCRGS